MSAGNLNELIFIKRVKKAHHDESHGGAWKIAYADFVTAMMAFFLLMWLLNATTEEQRTAISNYFAPASVSKSTSGSGGVLGGRTIDEDGAMAGSASSPGIILGIPQPSDDEEEEGDDAEKDEDGEQGAKDDADADGAAGKAEAGDQAAGDSATKTEDARFQAAGDALKEAIEADPLLREYQENLNAEITLAGLRIQLLDTDEREMFPMGSAEPLPHTREILARVAAIIEGLPNKVAISGHTDSVPFVASTGYSNWELSTDRAHAGRRSLINAGLGEDRVVHVAGRAAADPFIEENPGAPQNRRVSILLMREDKPKPAPSAPKAATAPVQEAPPAREPSAITEAPEGAASDAQAEDAEPGYEPLAEELWQRLN